MWSRKDLVKFDKFEILIGVSCAIAQIILIFALDMIYRTLRGLLRFDFVGISERYVWRLMARD